MVAVEKRLCDAARSTQAVLEQLLDRFWNVPLELPRDEHDSTEDVRSMVAEAIRNKLTQRPADKGGKKGRQEAQITLEEGMLLQAASAPLCRRIRFCTPESVPAPPHSRRIESKPTLVQLAGG